MDISLFPPLYAKKKEEELNEFTTKPEPSLSEIEILRLFWMEGVSTSYTIPATLLSPVSY